MPLHFDVVVVGLGAMGSAAAYHLARRGLSVLGVDRFSPPHAFGSSHGESRIIREAYFEHPLYVPLVQRAYELWAALEQESQQQLFLQTGGLMIGPPAGTLVTGARLSAETHHLSYELLSAAEIRRHFSAFQVAEEMVAVWEPRAGVLFPEKCIAAHLHLAERFGAAIHREEIVTSWQREGEGIVVVTGKNRYLADKLILTAGPWLKQLLPGLALPLQCTRQPLFWFEPARQPELFVPQRFPIYIWEHAPSRYFYGFPDLGEGVKIAVHHEGENTGPDQLRREVSPEEIETMRTLMRKLLPEGAGRFKKAAVCIYTNTPDSHFLIDFHPEFSRVLIASPCSGHGFKFSSVIGEILADLVMTGDSRFDLTPFGFENISRVM